MSCKHRQVIRIVNNQKEYFCTAKEKEIKDGTGGADLCQLFDIRFFLPVFKLYLRIPCGHLSEREWNCLRFGDPGCSDGLDENDLLFCLHHYFYCNFPGIVWAENCISPYYHRWN